VGNWSGEGAAYANLGACISRWGTLSERSCNTWLLRRRGGAGGGEGSYGIIGIAYHSLGDYSTAIECHIQHLAIAKEVGDRAGEGSAYGNLGNAYRSQGDYAKAIEYHTQDLAIAKDVGDRVGEGMAYATNLSAGHMYLNEFKHKTVAYFEYLWCARTRSTRAALPPV
jgi:tetratricopeptide (TPR) repeat protein